LGLARRLLFPPHALEALREIVATGRLGEAWKRLRDEIHHQTASPQWRSILISGILPCDTLQQQARFDDFMHEFNADGSSRAFTHWREQGRRRRSLFAFHSQCARRARAKQINEAWGDALVLRGRSLVQQGSTISPSRYSQRPWCVIRLPRSESMLFGQGAPSAL